MNVIHKNETPCGPAIACGAAYVTLDHKPGEPTSIDHAVAAIKRFFTHKRTTDSTATQGVTVDRPATGKTAVQGHAL